MGNYPKLCLLFKALHGDAIDLSKGQVNSKYMFCGQTRFNRFNFSEISKFPEMSYLSSKSYANCNVFEMTL